MDTRRPNRRSPRHAQTEVSVWVVAMRFCAIRLSLAAWSAFFRPFAQGFRVQVSQSSKARAASHAGRSRVLSSVPRSAARRPSSYAGSISFVAAPCLNSHNL